MDKDQKDLITFESSDSNEKDEDENTSIFGRDMVKVGTLNGKFDIDSVLACVITKLRLGNIIITRSRDQDVLDTCDILFGVGGEYNINEYKFDNTSKDFSETFDESSDVLLTSSGISWKYFGKEIIRNLISNLQDASQKDGKRQSITEEYWDHIQKDINRFVDELYISIYYKYIFEIDANNGGVPRLKDNVKSLDTENYSFHMNLPHIVSNYNSLDINNDVDQLESFNNAIMTVENIFVTSCKKLVLENVEFYYDYLKFQTIYSDPTRLPCVIDVTKWKNSYNRILNQYDPQRSFTKFIYYMETDETWILKTRHIPGKKFTSVVPIAEECILRDLCKKVGDDIINIDKKSYMASASSEECIKKIASFSLSEFKEDLSGPFGVGEHFGTNWLDLSSISKEFAIIGVALGCGYILAKINS